MHDWLVTDAQLALSIVIALGVVAVSVVWIVVPKIYSQSRGVCPAKARSRTLVGGCKGLDRGRTKALSQRTQRTSKEGLQ